MGRTTHRNRAFLPYGTTLFGGIGFSFSFAPPVADSMRPLFAENEQSRILQRLGKSEEDEPKHPFGCQRKGEQQGGKSQKIAHSTACKHPQSGAKRELCQTTFEQLKELSKLRGVRHRNCRENSIISHEISHAMRDDFSCCKITPFRMNHQMGCVAVLSFPLRPCHNITPLRARSSAPACALHTPISSSCTMTTKPPWTLWWMCLCRYFV